MPGTAAGQVPPPAVSQAQPISGPGLGDATAFQSLPAIAYGAGVYLAVWKDERNDDLWAARFDAHGEVLDQLGFPIDESGDDTDLTPPNGAHPGRHSVAFDGTNFLVVWPGGQGNHSDILGARVTPAGGILDPGGFRISTARDNQSNPSVSWDGEEYLVVWGDSRAPHADSDIYAARVTAHGTVLDQDGIPVSTAPGSQTQPRLSWSGLHFLVVWANWRGGDSSIYGARIATDGSVLDPDGIRITRSRRHDTEPDLAWDGQNHLVVWSRDVRDSVREIMGARIAPDGTVLDPEGFEISVRPTDGYNHSPSAAWAGDVYLVAWKRVSESVRGARVAGSGTVLDREGITIEADESAADPIVTTGSGTFGVVWEGNDAVRATGISSAGALQYPPVSVSISANSQYTPDIAWNGSMYFVVWIDDSDLVDVPSSVFGSRVTAAGDYLDDPGIPISESYDGFRPRVAWDGENFLVVWISDDRDVMGERISQQGVVLDPGGFVISQAGTNSWPALASDGTTTLVVWERQQSGHDVVGTRITPGGLNLDGDGFVVGKHTWIDTFPSVAWDGANWLVVWSQRLDEVDNILGARVTGDGDVLDLNPIEISIAPEGQFRPQVASSRDGTGSLVVWRDHRATELADVYAARVSISGDVMDADGVRIGGSTPTNSLPRVAWAGSAYLVAWQRQVVFGVDDDVLAARIGQDGSVIDRSPFVIDASGVDEFDPALTAGPEGRSAVVYVRFRLPDYAAWRVLLRFVDEKA